MQSSELRSHFHEPDYTFSPSIKRSAAEAGTADAYTEEKFHRSAEKMSIPEYAEHKQEMEEYLRHQGVLLRDGNHDD